MNKEFGKLFDDLLFNDKLSDEQELFFVEAEHRFEQLYHIIKRIKKSDDKIQRYGQAIAANKPAKRIKKWDIEIELDTESYYLFGLRLIDVLDSLPWFKNLKKSVSAKQVCKIANHLIKHAEGNEGVMSMSFGCGGSNGPTLKPSSSSVEKHKTRMTFSKGVYKEHADLMKEISSRALKYLT